MRPLAGLGEHGHQAGKAQQAQAFACEGSEAFLVREHALLSAFGERAMLIGATTGAWPSKSLGDWSPTIEVGLMEARSPADLVRQAFDSELGPEDIDRLVRDPLFIVNRLKAVYTDYEHPPLPPRDHAATRPFWSCGRESSGSYSAPVERTAVALNALIYHHEVVVRDPVEWFLYHDLVVRR